MAIAEQLEGEPAELVVVTTDQLCEGAWITGDGAIYELAIGGQSTRTGVPTSRTPDAHRWSIAELETRAQPCDAG